MHGPSKPVAQSLLGDRRAVDAHPPGGVQRLILRRGVEAPVHHPALAAEPVEIGEEPLAELFITTRRVELDAGVEAGNQNDALRQRDPEAGRDRDPVLGVEAVLVLTAECQWLEEREKSGPEW